MKLELDEAEVQEFWRQIQSGATTVTLNVKLELPVPAPFIKVTKNTFDPAEPSRTLTKEDVEESFRKVDVGVVSLGHCIEYDLFRGKADFSAPGTLRTSEEQNQARNAGAKLKHPIDHQFRLSVCPPLFRPSKNMILDDLRNPCAEIPLGVRDVCKLPPPARCECGAHKVGVQDFRPGHSDWCPVKAP